MKRLLAKAANPNSLHQILEGATQGDAMTAQAFLIRDWLREMGFVSDIYATHIHDSVKSEVRSFFSYRAGRHRQWVIYHHGTGSDVADFLLKRPLDIILIYHNVTPPEFFARTNPEWAHTAEQGQQQLYALRSRVRLALAGSTYNKQDLHKAGYANIDVLPIALSEREYNLSNNETLATQLEEKKPILLFIGRLVPNKKQGDLVKLLYYFRRIRSTAHLILVGDQWMNDYVNWVEDLAADLGLVDAVTLTGKVSQQDMVTYYRTADLYVSMSEHEGFGKPLIESMYLDLPVLAYSATGVPYTLDKASVLFHEKDYEQLAELVDILITDKSLRQRIIDRQKKRVEAFLEPRIRQLFEKQLAQLGLYPIV